MGKISAGESKTVDCFMFHVEENLEIIGLRFTTTPNFWKWEEVTFEVRDLTLGDECIVGKGDLQGKILFEGREY